jgi:hypothetical protein
MYNKKDGHVLGTFPSAFMGIKPFNSYGADGRGRTGTGVNPSVFETDASANSATSAISDFVIIACVQKRVKIRFYDIKAKIILLKLILILKYLHLDLHLDFRFGSLQIY